MPGRTASHILALLSPPHFAHWYVVTAGRHNIFLLRKYSVAIAGSLQEVQLRGAANAQCRCKCELCTYWMHKYPFYLHFCADLDVFVPVTTENLVKCLAGANAFVISREQNGGSCLQLKLATLL